MFINKNPKIFILSGKAKSGKDYVAKIIADYFPDSIKISYAYYLKNYVKNISNWDGCEENKPRELLQTIGIDLIQKQIDDQFLIKRVCDDIRVYSYFFNVIIITDARLIAEIEIPSQLFENVTTIRINNKEDNNLSEREKKHITETELDNYDHFDYVIENDEDLRRKILEVIEHV